MYSKIRGRMRCTVVSAAANPAITLVGVEGGRENDTFHNTDGAPTSQLTLTITNRDNKAAFEVGKEYTFEIKAVET